MRKTETALMIALAGLWPARGHASHEDYGGGARTGAMGEAGTASADDTLAVAFNPALAHQVSNIQVQTGLRRAHQYPGGSSDFQQLEAAAAAPLRAFPWRGGLAALYRETALRDIAVDRTAGLTYATHGWRETDDGVIDWGVTLKSISRSLLGSEGTNTKAAVDLGALYRIRESWSVAASALNVNGPRTDVRAVLDRAPFIARLGVAHSSRGFTAALDAARREPTPGGRAVFSLGSGIERWVHTGRIGAVALRSGLNLGDQFRSWTLGAGWRALGAQLDYALQVPVASGRVAGHSVSLVIRFGAWDPDKEFERLLGSEIRYRQELARALDSAEVKQWKLAEEMRRLRRELEDLQVELNTRTSGEADAQRKAREAQEKVRRLQDRLEEDRQALEQLEKERKAISERPKAAGFVEDWASYQRLKREGSSDAVLLDDLKRLLRHYKGSGADLSEANEELNRLLRAR